jgi:hypothetical protein
VMGARRSISSNRSSPSLICRASISSSSLAARMMTRL